jgi:hypothetical protein
MTRHRLPSRAHVPRMGLVCVTLIALSACGGTSASTTPSAATSQPSVAAASPVATPRPSPVFGGVCTASPIKFDAEAKIDLTGAWAGDDGGVVYVRQRGDVIWWNAMSNRDSPPEKLGRQWNNVGRGVLKSDLTIESDWVDVPRGQIAGYGTVNFKVGPDSAGNLQITKTSETGLGRGDKVWTRCTPGFPAG